MIFFLIEYLGLIKCLFSRRAGIFWWVWKGNIQFIILITNFLIITFFKINTIYESDYDQNKNIIFISQKIEKNITFFSGILSWGGKVFHLDNKNFQSTILMYRLILTQVSAFKTLTPTSEVSFTKLIQSNCGNRLNWQRNLNDFGLRSQR